MDQFTRLTAKLTNPSISVKDKLKGICDTTASLIQGANRVSLWVFSPDFESIETLICYDTSSRSYSSGQKLSKSDFEDYFSAILQNEIINAPDARTHDTTKCFKDVYFEPLNIYSLLDFILHRDFSPHGIICCESVNKVTIWSDKDIDTLKRIARASSMHFTYHDSNAS